MSLKEGLKRLAPTSENFKFLISLTALEQSAGELPGTIKERDIPIKCWDQCLVWEHSGDCNIPKTVPTKSGWSIGTWAWFPQIWTP